MEGRGRAWGPAAAKCATAAQWDGRLLSGEAGGVARERHNYCASPPCSAVHLLLQALWMLGPEPASSAPRRQIRGQAAWTAYHAFTSPGHFCCSAGRGIRRKCMLPPPLSTLMLPVRKPLRAAAACIALVAADGSTANCSAAAVAGLGCAFRCHCCPQAIHGGQMSVGSSD